MMSQSEGAKEIVKCSAQELPGPSRIAIFQCYDRDGIIDDYICYMLKDLCENLTSLVVVVNGTLSPEGRLRLEQYADRIFIREDKGFDAGAWKDTMIDYLGWDEVDAYDELVLLNDSFYGPFYPFREVFAEMENRPLDFWGLTDHAEDEASLPSGRYPHMPAHIQCYFTVFRRKLHTDRIFKKYWEDLPYFETAWETICGHEVIFARYFEDRGFSWDTLSSTKDIDGEFPDNQPVFPHCFFDTYNLIKERRCPVIKRHCFGFDYFEHLKHGNGMQLRQSMEYIAEHTNYDVSMIYKNLARVYNVVDIFYNLHLSFVLPKKLGTGKRKSDGRAVLVFHISYMDMLDYLRPYICSVPEGVDVIITTKPEKNRETVYQFFSPYLGDRLRVLVAEDPGRDLSALLVTAAPYLKDYEYIGFCHDKRSHKREFLTTGAAFRELLVENILGSGIYVENILRELEKHPEIGVLCPPHPHHCYWMDGIANNGWCGDFEEVQKLAKRLKLHTDIRAEKPALAMGTAFWCRRDALAPLLDYPWKLKDFPPEPLPTDGTMNHALERILPFVAQHQGYLTGWVMTDEYAELEINNMHYLRDRAIHQTAALQNVINTAAPNNEALQNAYNEALRQNQTLLSQQIGVKGALVNYFRKHTPKPLRGIAKKIKHLLRW